MKVRVITAVIGIIAVLLLVWLGGVFFSRRSSGCCPSCRT